MKKVGGGEGGGYWGIDWVNLYIGRTCIRQKIVDSDNLLNEFEHKTSHRKN